MKRPILLTQIYMARPTRAGWVVLIRPTSHLWKLLFATDGRRKNDTIFEMLLNGDERSLFYWDNETEAWENSPDLWAAIFKERMLRVYRSRKYRRLWREQYEKRQKPSKRRLLRKTDM